MGDGVVVFVSVAMSTAKGKKGWKQYKIDTEKETFSMDTVRLLSFGNDSMWHSS